jgi:hypothetical protein
MGISQTVWADAESLNKQGHLYHICFTVKHSVSECLQNLKINLKKSNATTTMNSDDDDDDDSLNAGNV